MTGPSRGRYPGPSRPRRSLRSDEGAAIVEAALVTPVFVLLIFGILEFGTAFRDYLALANAVSAGARQESIQGDQVDADHASLQSIRSASSAFPLASIDYVVVWKAAGPDDAVPAACTTASRTVGSASDPEVGSCNRFTVDDVEDPDGADWECAPPDPIRYWCPSTRAVTLSANGGSGPDYVGVYVHMTHPYVTGLFGDDIALTDTSVTKLEPVAP